MEACEAVVLLTLAVPVTLQLSKLPGEAAVALPQGLILLIQKVVALPKLVQFICRRRAERGECPQCTEHSPHDQPQYFLNGNSTAEGYMASLFLRHRIHTQYINP